MADTITVDKAWQLDAAWEDSGQPDDGLRCVTHRRNGNGSVTLLCIPGNDAAPCYKAVNSHYEHVSGPTLAVWQAQHDAAELEAVLQAEYRDEMDTNRSHREMLHW